MRDLAKMKVIVLSLVFLFFLFSFIFLVKAGFGFNSFETPQVTGSSCYSIAISVAGSVECKEGYYIKGLTSNIVLGVTAVKCCQINSLP